MMANGGIQRYYKLAGEKSQLFYDYLDSTDGFYQNLIQEKYRSKMNPTFVVRGNEQESQEFSLDAEKAGFVEILGHASAGGCRVSMYNNIEIDAVEALIKFMEDWRRKKLAQ